MSAKKPLSFNREMLSKLPPSEREKALQIINDLQSYEDVNPLYYYNHPILSEKPIHWKQLAFHAFPQRFRMFQGGNQSGKTTAGLVDDIIQAIDWEAVPEHLMYVKRYDPPCYIRIFSTDMVTLELTAYQKLRELVPPDQLYRGKWESAFNQQQRVLRFKNGSMIQFMTYKQEVSSMGGATLHRVHYDEEPPKAVWEENRLRVMRRSGDEILTMTPLQGLSWTYDVISDKYMRDEYMIEKDCLWETDDYGIVLVDMDDNPYLSEEDKHNALKDYPPEVIEARKKGRHIHFAGLIYGEFDKQEHVRDINEAPLIQWDVETEQPMVNPHANVVVSIDPGMRNRCAVVFAALDHQDNMVVFDELYEQGRTIKDISAMINLILAKWQVKPIYTVIDPAARNKNMQTGRSDQMEFADHGIVAIPGQHAVEAGINRVKERLRNKRLIILSHCVHLIREFEKYRWKEAPKTGEDGKPVPVKTEDHAMDALRYLVMSRPYMPEEYKVRSETKLQRIMREDQERYSKPTLPSGSYGGGVFA